jgi:hypothetical protein
MKIREADDKNSIRALLDYLNVCHDGFIRRISFIKDREYIDEDGSILYPSDEDGYDIICDIEMDMLLNSYVGASPHQIVVLTFENVMSFRFFQESTFDYSEIYEVNFDRASNGTFDFSFYEPSKNMMLTLNCSKVICKEYVESME